MRQRGSMLIDGHSSGFSSTTSGLFLGLPAMSSRPRQGHSVLGG
jgi:hypothetical protein